MQGFLQQIKYKDGDFVKEGTTFFVIEPSHELKLEQAQAAEAGAQATLKQTEAEYERQVELSSRQVATKAALDNATANRTRGGQAQAGAGRDQASSLNLGYTREGPFDGIVTARLVSLGELVGANGPTQLATIVQTNPIYVNFSINEQEVLSIRADMRRLGLTVEQLKQFPIEVGLQSDEGYPSAARSICFSHHRPRDRHARRAGHSAERERHAGAGQFRPRAGGAADEHNSLLVPDAAIGSDQGGRYLLVVGKDGLVEQRKVTIGPRVGELRVIESGLKPEDRVVVAGILGPFPARRSIRSCRRSPPRRPQPPAASSGGA